MAQQYSLAHLTALSCSPPELIRIAAKAGYDFVSLRMTAVTTDEPFYPLITDRNLMAETKSTLVDTGMAVLDIELARLDAETEPEEYEKVMERGAELGARSIIAQLPDPDRERATERFARLCDLAQQFNLSVDLEFPSWTETPDLRTAIQVIRAVNKPNAGMLIDTLHFDRSASRLEELKELPAHWFNFLHLCDAPSEHPSTLDGLLHTAREERFYPGEGGLNIKDVLACVPPVPYSLEIPNVHMSKELGVEEYVRQALATTKKYLGH
ncbi:sugar phosphate isomerase/epimerase family protein [Desulfosediminicola flagellatus]|uniref:sugar phosphate isomerase/epimerase family protein n=1 Tax=Desulfosediminicola flagellatus TaxID=2569541 RepID=UPI0010AB7431|nr:TIM barrel protein [Desulfosediminicola flagellatus]